MNQPRLSPPRLGAVLNQAQFNVLMYAMRDLEQKVQLRWVRAGMRKALKWGMVQAKSDVPTKTFKLFRHLNITITTSRVERDWHNADMVGFVGVKQQRGVRFPFWAHFQEYGTVNHSAKMFLRPVLPQKSREMEYLFMKDITRKINLWAKKQAALSRAARITGG